MPFAQLPIMHHGKEYPYDPRTTQLVESMVATSCFVYSGWCHSMPTGEATSSGKCNPTTSTITGYKFPTPTQYKGEFNHGFLLDAV
jgi:hypothetical protein